MKNKFILKFLKSSVVVHVRKVLNAESSANISTYSASVGYYTIFSIGPLLVIAISISSIFIKANTAQNTIILQFQNVFGKSGADFIQMLIQSKESYKTSIILSVISFIILLIGAMGIFTQLQKGLDAIFHSLPKKVIHSTWASIRQKLLSLGMVLSVGFLLLVSLIFSAMMNTVLKYLSPLLPKANLIFYISEFIISFIGVSFLLALVYKVLPSKKLTWKPALVGGLIAGILFLISKYLLGWYLGSSTAYTSYGKASSLVLLILWGYYMSQVFFFSAVLVRLYIIPKLNKNHENKQ